MGEAGQLSLIGVAFEPLCSQIWVVLGGVGEAFEPLCNDNNNNNNDDDRNILVQAETDLV